MNRQKVMLVFGTRPEAIKMCPLVKVLNKRETIQTVVCVTGQHKQMLEQVLQYFHVKPDYDISIMKDEQSLFDISTGVLTGMNEILVKEKPDVVLVHGDTTTAFATALACFYLKVPVGHVEAGLRTYNMHFPYPEELNRRFISLVSEYDFAPTGIAADNLEKEGKEAKSIYITGNTIIDALKYTYREDYTHPELDWVGDNRLVFITAHRRENIGEPMHHMFRAIRRVLNEHPDVRAVYPVHMNPLVREIAYEELGDCKQVHLIEPIDVLDCHNFEARSYLCLTDSGGIQEECTAYGKPVLLMRDTTERPEGVDAGIIKLTGTNEDAIYHWFTELLDDQDEYNKMAKSANLYGDGYACERIADILEGKKTASESALHCL